MFKKCHAVNLSIFYKVLMFGTLPNFKGLLQPLGEIFPEILEMAQASFHCASKIC